MDYEKYLVRKPLYRDLVGIKNRQSPTMTFISPQQIPDANYNLELGWIYGIPQPNPYEEEHIHDYDEIIIHWGSDPEHPQSLGGEIEYYIGGQLIDFNTTCGMFIPKGVSHGRCTWKKFSRPHVQMSLKLGHVDNIKGTTPGEDYKITGAAELKNRGSDYEQYVIRSPLREAGAEFVRGRTSPTMTYMSGLQIPGVKCYIEFGWTFDMPSSKRAGTGMPAMLHDNFDEIVLHIGGDPARPEELGGEIEFFVGGQPLLFSTSSALFLPRGLLHGPLACKKYEKPHIVMAIMAGIGSMREGWNALSTAVTKNSG
jgi:hypothetical protein